MAYDRALSSSQLQANLLVRDGNGPVHCFMADLINPHTWDVVKYDIGSVHILYHIKTLYEMSSHI
jgi:hypothetical protein